MNDNAQNVDSVLSETYRSLEEAIYCTRYAMRTLVQSYNTLNNDLIRVYLLLDIEDLAAEDGPKCNPYHATLTFNDHMLEEEISCILDDRKTFSVTTDLMKLLGIKRESDINTHLEAVKTDLIQTANDADSQRLRDAAIEAVHKILQAQQALSDLETICDEEEEEEQ